MPRPRQLMPEKDVGKGGSSCLSPACWAGIWVVGTQVASLHVFPGKPHLMVGVVLGVGGPLSRLRWLWTGLCAGGTSGLRAGSLREKSETALCTAQEREGKEVSRAPCSSAPSTPAPLTNHLPPSHTPPSQTTLTFPIVSVRSQRHLGWVPTPKPNQVTPKKSHPDSEQAFRPNDQFRPNARDRKQVKRQCKSNHPNLA